MTDKQEPTKPEDMVTPAAMTVAFVCLSIVLRALRLTDTPCLLVSLGIVLLLWLVVPQPKKKE